MTLIKWFRGRRVKVAKRRGDRILIKLAGSDAGELPQWIAVTPEEYQAELVYRYVPSGAVRRTRPEPD